MKKCSKCKELKQIDCFHRCKGKADGRQNYCKACSRIRGRKWREDNVDHSAQYSATKRAGPVGRAQTLYYSAVRRAVTKRIPFDITVEWILARMDRCQLTGIEFDMAPRKGVGRRVNPYSPSLDRIRTAGGYTRGNTRVVLSALNTALSDWGEEVFANIAEAYISKKKTVH